MLRCHAHPLLRFAGQITGMIQWPDSTPIYLHRDTVDFRKEVNGLAVIISEEMALDVYDSALFVFCNKNRTQLKVLDWNNTDFARWQKRLEKDKFKWPKRGHLSTVTINRGQWSWLFLGFDITKYKPHKQLFFTDVILLFCMKIAAINDPAAFKKKTIYYEKSSLVANHYSQ